MLCILKGLIGLFPSNQLSLQSQGMLNPLTPPMRSHKFCSDPSRQNLMTFFMMHSSCLKLSFFYRSWLKYRLLDHEYWLDRSWPNVSARAPGSDDSTHWCAWCEGGALADEPAPELLNRFRKNFAKYMWLSAGDRMTPLPHFLDQKHDGKHILQGHGKGNVFGFRCEQGNLWPQYGGPDDQTDIGAMVP